MNESWYPSKYGAGDEIGSLNHITTANVLRAARLVTQGRAYDLSHILDEAVPAFPGRSFRQHLVTSAHQINRRRPDAGELGGWGENNMNWILEIVSGTSQMGTHLDALNHIQIGDRCYNGHRLDEVVEAHGTNRLGMETVPQIVTRGVLVDIARLHGVARLEAGHAIRVEEVQEALNAQQVAVNPGDALLFHTGWGGLWRVDNPAYVAGEPGPGMEVAAWLVEQDLVLSGCDTWSFGPVPPEDKRRPFEVPQTLNARHGFFILENLFTAQLAADRVYEFMFVCSHAKLRGATGAWVAPLALI